LAHYLKADMKITNKQRKHVEKRVSEQVIASIGSGVNYGGFIVEENRIPNLIPLAQRVKEYGRLVALYDLREDYKENRHIWPTT
jgi:hypothetical protein